MMGKLTNSTPVEIIPLDDTPHYSRDTVCTRTPLLGHHPAKMQRLPYMSDPTIVPRVQKYLETNVDKTYVDINVMADDLQRKYREYAKRKRSAFRSAVKKAYSIVLTSYGVSNPNGSSSEDLSDDSAVDEDVSFQENSLSSQLLEMYTRPLANKQVDENELIDISSDDSNDQPYQNQNEKSTNGASTSQRQSPVPPQYTNSYKVPENERPPLQNDRGKKRKLGKEPQLLHTAVKKKKSVATLHESKVTFADVGGLDKVLEDVCKLLVHIRHPEVYKQIGISPPRGFLLHGPPGCGKTLLANAIAGELNVPLLKVAAPELVAGVSGESEERIRELFERATLTAPCVLFIDEIDAITPNRQNAQKEMERRIVAQILSCLDDLNQSETGNRVLVIGATNRPDSIDPALRRAGRFDREVCLGIPDAKSRCQILKIVSNGLRLSEDVDFEGIAKYTPGFVGADLASLVREAAMAAVNRVFNELKEKRLLEEAISIQQSIQDKPVEVAAPPKPTEAKPDDEIIVDGDAPVEPPVTAPIQANNSDTSIVVIDDDVKQQEKPAEVAPPPLVKNEMVPVVAKNALEELISWLHNEAPLTNEQLNTLFISAEDFKEALKCVQPSAKREGFATVPDVTWEDVGSLQDIRDELKMSILGPVQHAEQFAALGISSPTGVLLCGPPGCGKTLLAKAIANEAGINFISVKGPELLNMYLGESERAVRVCFERARNSAPCVIFFDELDALCPKRSDSREGGATMRVVNQMLTEMDGMQTRKDVFLLAASNRPDIIDPAILRPGRLDKILYVGLPSAGNRVEILRALTKNGTRPPLAPFVDLEAIGASEKCDGYTGADLAALVRETGVIALKEFLAKEEKPARPLLVTTEHFQKAIAKIRPSVSEKDQKHYEKLRKLYTSVADEGDVEEMEYS